MNATPYYAVIFTSLLKEDDQQGYAEMANQMEELAKYITLTISHAVEILAAVIIGIAVIKAMHSYISLLKKPAVKITKETIRVHFGSSVAVSLEL